MIPPGRDSHLKFDGSAASSNGHSTRWPLSLLTSVLNRFRVHNIGMSSDISKMFREVGLTVSDRNLHRFFHEDSSGLLQEWRMCRLTFGVTCSPFLASKVLLQLAELIAIQKQQKSFALCFT